MEISGSSSSVNFFKEIKLYKESERPEKLLSPRLILYKHNTGYPGYGGKRLGDGGVRLGGYALLGEGRW